MAYSHTDSRSADTSISRSLLKELVELRQIRLEKESLQQANVHYMTLVSHLELTISELKVQLQAKDAEVAKWKSRTKKLTKKLDREDTGKHSLDRSKEELTNKVLLLEEENAQLKSHAALKSEMERLRLQLEQSHKMQSMYREKYQETKVRLVTLTTEQSESSDSRVEAGDNQYSTRKQCKTAASMSPKESWLEVRGSKNAPQLRKGSLAMPSSSGSASAMAFLIPEKPIPTVCKTSTVSLKSSPMSSFALKGKSRTSALINHKSSMSKATRKSIELKAPALSAYIPSFTRAKKAEKPTNHRPSPTQEATTQPQRCQLPVVTDESEFADFFPSDNELD